MRREWKGRDGVRGGKIGGNHRRKKLDQRHEMIAMHLPISSPSFPKELCAGFEHNPRKKKEAVRAIPCAYVKYATLSLARINDSYF